jgi:hypothetical protein
MCGLLVKNLCLLTFSYYLANILEFIYLQVALIYIFILLLGKINMLLLSFFFLLE